MSQFKSSQAVELSLPTVLLEHRKSTAADGWRTLAGLMLTIAAFVGFGI